MTNKKEETSTHIRLDTAVKSELDKLKLHKRESYNDLLKRIVLNDYKTGGKNENAK